MTVTVLTNGKDSVMYVFPYFGLSAVLFVLHMDDVQSSGFGRCPNYPSMPKFNMTKVRVVLVV